MQRILFSGLMLMSFYFGAGNLIFAPEVGLQAGENFIPALSGFSFTAVVIPFLALLALTMTGDSAISFYGRAGKTYGYVMTMIIVMSIGPLFAIPRVANVSYELGIANLLPADHGVKPAIDSPFGISFIFLFFLIAFTLALYGDKLVDAIGKVLAPALILFIVALIIVFTTSDYQKVSGEAIAKFSTGPVAFSQGALAGYGTLDALASVVFAGLIIQSLRPAPDTPANVVRRNVVYAGAIACFLLAVIYFALGYLGNVTADSGQKTGAGILTFTAVESFGPYGQLVFAIIVFLACITTAVGLLKMLSTYLFNMFGYFSEKTYLLVFTILAGVLSIQGLQSVLKTSLPMIVFTYPVTISLMIVVLLDNFSFTKDRVWVYRMVAILVTTLAGLEAFKSITGVDLLGPVRNFIPFTSGDFPFITPLIAGMIIGFFMPKGKVPTYLLGDRNAEKRSKKHQYEDELDDVIG